MAGDAIDCFESQVRTMLKEKKIARIHGERRLLIRIRVRATGPGRTEKFVPSKSLLGPTCGHCIWGITTISPLGMFAQNCVWIAGTLKFIPRCAIPASVRLSAPGAWVTSTVGTRCTVMDTGRDNGCHVLFKESGKQVLVPGRQVACRVPHPFARLWRKGGNN